jgi:F-type H+-transporting ATPase subunit a
MPIHLLHIFLSLAVITACTVIGLTHYGVQFFAIFIPEGMPLMLTPLLVLIESVSYIARAFSLGIRLGANIIAGHSLLVIVSSFVSVMLSPLSRLVLFCPIGLLIIFALFLMELGVAILQAYILCFLPHLIFMTDFTYIRHSVKYSDHI